MFRSTIEIEDKDTNNISFYNKNGIYIDKEYIYILLCELSRGIFAIFLSFLLSSVIAGIKKT